MKSTLPGNKKLQGNSTISGQSKNNLSTFTFFPSTNRCFKLNSGKGKKWEYMLD